MSLPRLYAASLPDSVTTLSFDDDACRHAQVLRLAAGDRVCLFDAAGRSAEATITNVKRGAYTCSVQPARSVPPPARRLHLILGIPKAAKLEMIVRMVTELGVHAVYLAHTERSVPKLSTDSPKLERLRRIGIEACAQSGQAWAPQLAGPMALAEAAAAAEAEAERLVFWENSKRPLGLQPTASNAMRDVWAIVGPEGGISEREVDVLRQLGYVDIGLGAGILRVETACVAISTLLLDRMGVLR